MFLSFSEAYKTHNEPTVNNPVRCFVSKKSNSSYSSVITSLPYGCISEAALFFRVLLLRLLFSLFLCKRCDHSAIYEVL